MSSDHLTPLILDFLEWLAPAPRPYSEVMEAWRTSCPRLTVWEDATEQGLVERVRTDSSELFVDVTIAGRQFLRKHRGVATAKGVTSKPSLSPRV
ncbi:MAG: hypothetical protein K2X60_00810 [Xanthobacteraceae bacterium]|nr:hypothetical protein [Xanthobacteraceae bacterium]